MCSILYQSTPQKLQVKSDMHWSDSKVNEIIVFIWPSDGRSHCLSDLYLITHQQSLVQTEDMLYITRLSEKVKVGNQIYQYKNMELQIKLVIKFINKRHKVHEKCLYQILEYLFNHSTYNDLSWSRFAIYSFNSPLRDS